MRFTPLFLAATLLVAPLSSFAQPPPGPSGYVENIEDPGDVGGPAEEVAGEEAQAEEYEQSGSVRAVSRSQAGAIEEIVVQARKRAEFLEDTPISVTALSENTLRQAGVTRLDDIQTLVPNLKFQSGTEGMAANIIIRGVGTPQSAAIAFDPGVGVYVDGVFLPRTIGTLIDVVNIEQVEVLRGPQGTLFGKNTVGGALNITTVKPRDELEGFALIRPSNFGGLFTQAMVNLPIVPGRVLGRFAMSSTNSSGFTTNTYQNVNYNNRNSLTFLGTLRFLPMDDLTIDVTGTWSRDHNASRSGNCVYVQQTTLGDLVPGLKEACDATTQFTNTSNIAQMADVRSYGLWGTIAYDVGEVGVFDDLVVKSITSWRQQIPRLRNDVDQTSANALWRSSTGGDPQNGTPGFQQQISTELQVNGSAWDDRIDFVAGYFVFWEKGRDSQVLAVVPTNLEIENRRLIDNWNWALYTQATVDATDWLSLTAGVRYTEEKKGLTAQNFAVPSTDPAGNIPPGSAIFAAWTPMASIAAFAPDDWLDTANLDHLMGYFTYSRGFRGGGFNGVINPILENLEQFSPEFLNSFEIGFKTIGWDKRATLNVSLFYGDYTDIQVTTQREAGDLDGDGVLDIDQVTENAAQATQKGAEIEALVLPIDGLQINGSVGLLYTKFDKFLSFSALTGDPISRAGESFNNAPELQTHVAAQYSFEIPLEGMMAGWLTPRIEWFYQSSFHALGPDFDAATQRGYNLMHARLSYEFLDDRAQVALWGKNLLDVAYVDAISPVVSSFGFATRYYEAPRTYGGEISYSF